MPSKDGRIAEADLLVPTLRILASKPDGTLSTSELISALEKEFEPEGEDAEILEGRQDSRFSQIVRNMVSHKKSPGNAIAEGYIEHLGPRVGLRITAAGRAYLKSKGF
jgi:hypothetical protein